MQCLVVFCPFHENIVFIQLTFEFVMKFLDFSVEPYEMLYSY